MFSCAMLRNANDPVGNGEGKQLGKHCPTFLILKSLWVAERTGEGRRLEATRLRGIGCDHRLYTRAVWKRRDSFKVQVRGRKSKT